MNSILIVEDDHKLADRVWPGKRAASHPMVTSWHDFASAAPRPVDVVILNLEDPGAPTLIDAVRLREKQPDVGFIYVVDVTGTTVPKRALTALSKPGVAWVSSKASKEELLLRSVGLADVIKNLRKFRTAKSSEPRQDVLPATPTSKAAARSPWEHLVPALHNPKSGRLDAARTAEWFGVSLKTMAGLLERAYPTVHKTPDAVGLQGKLMVFLRIASALLHKVGSERGAKIWLNAPNPDLEDDQTPLSAIEVGEQEIIAELLEDSLVGQPG